MKRKSRVPAAKRREASTLSRAYRSEADRLRRETEEAAPVLTWLRATLATCAESCVRAWVETNTAALTVDARTSAIALRLIGEWWDSWDDPLPDEPPDFWLWARERLRQGGRRAMTLQVTFHATGLVDLRKQLAAALDEIKVPVEIRASPMRDEVRNAMVKYVAEHGERGQATVASVLKKYGATTLSTVAPEHYAAVIAELEPQAL